MPPTEVELTDAVHKMCNAKTLLFHAGERELATKEALKKAEAAILLKYADTPKELGGNEPARNARLRELTVPERADADQADRDKRACQLAFDLASMAVDCLKWQIRINMVKEE
jgi:hypothetical protein